MLIIGEDFTVVMQVHPPAIIFPHFKVLGGVQATKRVGLVEGGLGLASATPHSYLSMASLKLQVHTERLTRL
jgi:hypothetical protein